MIYRYNTERLKKVIWDFYHVTGISVSILDAEFNCLAIYPDPMVKFCRLIQGTQEGRCRCLESDIRLFRECLESRCARTHTCHAGLEDTVVPIFNNEILLGFIIFGQVAGQSDRKRSFASIYDNIKDLNLDRQELQDAYDDLNSIEKEKLKSTAEVVSILTKYIMFEHMIQPDYDNNTGKIIEYIDNNLTGELSVYSICQRFNISKNTLYHIFNSNFQCGVKEYINMRRISLAERLLKTTDLLIYEVCEKCGIDNYQYFCRLFKKKKGITPLQYKKRWKNGR